jgi:hypothetical protein
MAVGDRTLKRLLRRKGLSKLVDDLIERSGNGPVVTDAAGRVVLGNAAQISDASAEIQADGRLIGHVHGDDARHLADVLSLLAEQSRSAFLPRPTRSRSRLWFARRRNGFCEATASRSCCSTRRPDAWS